MTTGPARTPAFPTDAFARPDTLSWLTAARANFLL